ncbi:TIGR03571 family LLM class oxidoreductase [Salipiger abyssi]|uniref:TIGR03571 family LLM class oxidoreductase n=1 Tax=Salipiger abyssi TaxID=1250539 RepID=UPI004059F49D
MTARTKYQPDVRQAMAAHPGYRRLFAPGEITLGLIMPLETYAEGCMPTMRNHLATARHAEEIGIPGLWLLDIPFFDPSYGAAGQLFEPLTYMAALAMVTEKIALGTTGIVLPFRDPHLFAKQMASVDQLSGGRCLAGLSLGDRRDEYPLFGIDFDTRAERFREIFRLYRTVSEHDRPAFSSDLFGNSPGGFDMLPKPPFARTPTIAINGAGQSLDWVAREMEGIMVPISEPERLAEMVAEWRAAQPDDAFKPVSIVGFLHLEEDPDHPFERDREGFHVGSRALARFMEQAREAGVSHFAMNPRYTRRPMEEVLFELERDVLPHFPALEETD